ncbi:uncharacterized protein [Oryza sativa Japonica Group]|uniref:cDNA, clone: J080303A07, full insert sequence n=2 Tax=Oryza sativa subsp. japonica TaxID=39947 RepID=Q7XW59_ORYSJ|nr:uncharacterized protein LOC9269354 isoform X1 [Oryza sativa Japonica Group]KAF2933209.1 hypothetical protein DAI22_04g065400 [Oryza sativa Japonica Group]BAH01291.1 unnamed protein product [Oryza sativa Japonica Group]CAD40246.2 OSJNBb0096E05.12 [Oryza sativa Japonica Group]
MASDGLGGAVPRSNPVTTVVLRPDPVAAGVPRLTSHGSTGGGGRRAACGRPPCSPLLLFLLPLLPARCRHRGCPPPACRVAAAVCRWTSTLTRPPRASPPRWTSRTRLQECSEFVEFSAPQLTIMGEAATPERQEDVVQVAGHASSTA